MDEKIIARFWSKVDKRGPDECWEWLAAKSPLGYGAFGVRSDDIWLAHRFSAALVFGIDVVLGTEAVCHICDNPPCVNPAHLFLGIRADNLLDMWQKSRGVIAVPLSNGKGEDHPQSRLKDGDVLAIRYGARVRSCDQQTFADQMARRYGITRSNVLAIIYRRSWRHI